MKTYRKRRAPCPWCTSGDAYFEFFGEEEKWVGHCYSCNKQEYVNDNERGEPMEKPETKVVHPVDTEPLDEPYRGLRPKTLKKFNTTKFTGPNGEIGIVYDYGESQQKIRFQGKKFQWRLRKNTGTTLFGSNVFPKGGKRITITEGENDAMAVYDIMGDYPVVSLRDGANSITQFTSDDVDYLNSFNEIIVCFDNDKPGKEAINKFSGIFGAKVRIVNLPSGYKDAHQMLEEEKRDEFRHRWWNPVKWSPPNIVFPIDIKDKILYPKNEHCVPYPWEGLNQQIFGLHLPELVTLSAQPKIGKSFVTAAIVHHLHETTDAMVADLTVENTPDERNRTLFSLKIKKPLHLQGKPGINLNLDKDKIEEEFDKYFGDRRIVSFERDGITQLEQIFERIIYMVEVLGCTYIIFDHVNYAASYHEQDERKALDIISNKLADLAKDKRVCVIAVSHENDEGNLFGSRNLRKASHTVIRLTRDREHKNPIGRDITKLVVTDSRRYGSRCGSPVYLKYDEESFSMTELDKEFAESILEGGVEEA